MRDKNHRPFPVLSHVDHLDLDLSLVLDRVSRFVLGRKTHHAYADRDLVYYAFCFSFVTPLVKNYVNMVSDICHIYHFGNIMQVSLQRVLWPYGN